MKLNHQVIGNVGLYYCCYRLSLLGWNVMPTARNARGVDIIAYNIDASRFLSIQVKTLSKRNPVPLGNSVEKVIGDFWIIVSNVVKHPLAFILKPVEVLENAHRSEKDGRVSYWIETNSYEREEFRDKWERIGYGDIIN